MFIFAQRVHKPCANARTQTRTGRTDGREKGIDLKERDMGGERERERERERANSNVNVMCLKTTYAICFSRQIYQPNDK